MNHTLIVQRAFRLVRRYKVLWVLGILFALTASGNGGNPAITLGNGTGDGLVGPSGSQAAFLVAFVVALMCLVLVLVLVAIVVRYVVQAGLFRSVEEIEDMGDAPSFRQAWRLGWTFRAVRLFLIDLVVFIPLAFLGFAVFILVLSPLLLLFVDSTAVRVFSIVLTVGLGLLLLLLFVVGGILIGLTMEFIRRAAVLDDRGVFDSIAQGVRMVRRRFQDVGIMWLLMFGIGLGYALLMIPVFLLLMGVALLAGGGVGFLLYELTDAIWLSFLIGGPIAALILFVPLLLIGGYYEAFKSATWTLTYREVRAPAI